MTTKYAYQNFNDHTVKASGRALPISTKVAVEICNRVRGMSVDKALIYLKRVTELKEAVPFKRFNDGVGHRRGPMAAGRFPVKAAQHVAAVIASAQANAQAQNFDESLKIVHICANKAAGQMHQGRQRSRQMKRTHVEVVLKEMAKPAAEKKSPVKQAAESKPTVEAKA